MRLVKNFPFGKGNARNSEGAFLRRADGIILFAYSRYCGDDFSDDASCDIAMITSPDEGEHWTAPEIIAHAKQFGVKNIMSVSSVVQKNGDLGFYFIIKENDGSSSLGRAISADGLHFTAERCQCTFSKGYYVFNNDRLERLKDGRLIFPAAQSISSSLSYYISTLMVSEDDGHTFSPTDIYFPLPKMGSKTGTQEPGVLELKDGSLWVWFRTDCGCQYESFSRRGLEQFSLPAPSQFTSPCSPMEIYRAKNGTLYNAYNPAPSYNGRSSGGWHRTPFVICKSADDGMHWGELTLIEDDPMRGYCYPAFFETNDNALLLAYCRGKDCCLSELGITKISLDEIK